ncbi:MAG: hypothetical protein JSR20_08870 [Nitrospira sp.]|nr:hypothetical protein [Nitrospira sp.]
MARAKATEPVRSRTKPQVVEELTRGIATLRELSVQIDDLSRDGFPYREAVRARTELSFRETIRRLFGEKSPEYQTHKNHKLKVGTRAESTHSTALLKEFIAALEIQKAELLGLKSDEIIAGVSPAPDRPSLTVVPHATPPDSTTVQPAPSPAPQIPVPTPSAPAPTTVAAATISPSLSAVPPSITPAPVVAPASPPPVMEVAPQPSRDTVRPRPTQQAPSGNSASVETTVVSKVALPQPSVASPVPATTAAPTTPSSTNSSTTSTASEALIPTGTLPPVTPTARAIPSGTIPPVPHTTLRPRPSPVASTESLTPAQPAPIVTTPQLSTSTPVSTPPPAAAPPVAAPTSTVGLVPAPEVRHMIPPTQMPEPTGTTPTPRQETSSPQAVAQMATQIQPSTPAPSQATAPAKVQEESGTLEVLRRVCARFHLVARQLRLRKEYRPTLEINDEYDLQDLFYALLRLQFDEVGTDDWSPPYANGTQRTSYLLDWGKTVVIVKQTRSGLSSKDLAEQIAADKSHYAARPDAATLVCFIYDPEGRVGNPRGLEADLTTAEPRYRVEVLVAPK